MTNKKIIDSLLPATVPLARTKSEDSVQLLYAEQCAKDRSLAGNDGLLYCWQDDHWEALSDLKAQGTAFNWLSKFDRNRATAAIAQSCVEAAKLLVRQLPASPKQKVTIIPLRDCWLFVDQKGAITAIEPDIGVGICHRISCDKSIPPGPYTPEPLKPDSLFAQFLASSLPNQQVQDFVQEYIGYTLTGTTKLQVGTLWVGAGNDDSFAFSIAIREEELSFGEAMRLRGPLFEAGTDYRSLAPPTNGKPGTVMLTVPEYQKALVSLDTLVSERRAFNIKAYLTPRTFPRTQGAGSASATLKPANFTRATIKETTMPIKKTPHTERIVEDAITTAKQADDEHVKKPVIASTEQATQRMKAMRENGTTVYTPKPSTAMDTINSIQAAIGALQHSINAAVADMANATTPDEAKKAQQRLMALMEQMARLEQQLQEAKVRQINEAPVMKLKV